MFRYLVLAVSMALLAGCDGASTTVVTPPEHVYHVRGVIKKMPAAGAPQAEMLLKHEAIPEFVGSDGTIEQMPAMTMPFPLAPNLDLGGLAVGSAVEFTYEVRWRTTPHEQITQIRPVAPSDAAAAPATPAAG